MVVAVPCNKILKPDKNILVIALQRYHETCDETAFALPVTIPCKQNKNFEK